MKRIFFTPKNFQVGASYVAELLLNGSVQQTKTNLVENTQYSFDITTPDTYQIRVRSIVGDCIFTDIVQALFPIVTFTTGEVDCDQSVYTYTITLTNPSTAGSNVQYGWSTSDICSSVSNWTSNPVFTLPSDELPRYVFVKNNDAACCSLISSTFKTPCNDCTLAVTGISFSCNG